jgi:hypothetical protein
MGERAERDATPPLTPPHLWGGERLPIQRKPRRFAGSEWQRYIVFSKDDSVIVNQEQYYVSKYQNST